MAVRDGAGCEGADREEVKCQDPSKDRVAQMQWRAIRAGAYFGVRTWVLRR
jgi:hypothetical protein